MFCEKCGAKLEEQAAFCDCCGQKVMPPEPEEATQPNPEEAVLCETDATAEAPASEAPAEVAPVQEEVPAMPVIEPQPVFAAPVNVPVAPVQKQNKPYKPRRKPHILLRIPMQLLSFLLCLVLAVSLVATVALADLNHLMSAGGIKQIINAVLIPTSAPQRIHPAAGALGVHMDDAFTLPGDLDLGDLPEDILQGGGSEENIGNLIDWLYEELEKATEEPLPVTKEQLESFVEESTISDFVAEKLAGYADDFINGTENTEITSEEIMDLLDENLQLIEETFQVEVTEEVKQKLTDSVEKVVEENDLNTVIRQEVFESVEQAINDSASATGMRWEDIQPMLQLLCSDAVLFTALGICLALMLLLCLLNFYNVPAGLTWIAVPSILMGAILTAPLALLQAAPQLMADALTEQIASIIASFAGVLMPFHAAVLVMGLALLVISIVWRIIRSSIDRKRRLAAA